MPKIKVFKVIVIFGLSCLFAISVSAASFAPLAQALTYDQVIAGQTGGKVLGASTPALVQNKTGTSITSITLSNPTTAGNLLTIMSEENSAADIASITDTVGNAWSLAARSALNSNNQYVETWYAPNIIAATTEIITINYSGAAYNSVYAAEWSGVVKTSPLDTASVNTGANGTTASATLSLTGTDLVTGVFIFGTGAAMQGTGFTNIDSDKFSLSEYAVSSVSPVIVTGTGHDSPWSIVGAAFKGVSGASDATPPTVPTGLSATTLSSSQINLSWAASTDPVVTGQVTSGVTGYTIYRGGVQVGTSAGNSYSDSGLTASTSYNYTVDAYDAAGNHSGQSLSASATTQVGSSDTQAPSVPTNLSATAVSSSAINLSWTASLDNVAVIGYKIYRGGSQITTSAANNYSDTGLAASTQYTYAVSAYDAAGNNSAQSSGASATTQAASQGSTVNAASCSSSDVQAAFNSVTSATTVVNIPAGTCIWAVPVALTVPSGNMNLSVMGAGSQSVVGGNDQTVIIDHTGASSALLFSASALEANLRFSGVTIKQDGGSTATNNCVVAWTGNTHNLRVDHSHFWVVNEKASTCMGIVYGSMFGVFDHNLFDLTPAGVDNGIRVKGGSAFGDSSGNGNGSWSNPTSFGSANFVFFENNIFNYSIANDCTDGGRQVFRYNTFNDSSIQTHEMEGDARGCRATEAYSNIFNGSTTDSINSFSAVGYRMGTGLVWGNTTTNMRNLIILGSDRTNGHPFNAPPDGFGYCGTLGSIAGPSAWDGNSIGSTGYPCIDQAGRGQSDVLSGLFPTKCDMTTGCLTYNGVWPNNKLEPIYEWLNQYQIGGTQNQVYYNQDTNIFAANRDYYAYVPSWNGSSFTGAAFNGTVGTGSGPLSVRPSTCTAGPGGNTNGVAYWATDTNTLYVCNPTNTWTVYYTPYPYPHPLDTTGGSGGSDTTPPAPPTNVAVY